MDGGSGYERLMAHDVVILLFLASIVLALSGESSSLVAGAIGIVLCFAGCLRGGVTVDLWVLIPLLVFDLFSMASSYMTYQTIARGYAPTQTIFIVIYLMMAYLSNRERQMLRQLCAVWAGAVAALGVVEFLHRTLTRGAARLSGLLGNPNALGIFLVVGWTIFLLDGSEKESGSRLRWRRLEPIILVALALTLSMGSFLSMAVGILLVLIQEKRSSTWRGTWIKACQLLARASVGIGIGILMYVAARKTDIPWLSVLLALYLLAAAWNWELFLKFLQDRPWPAAVTAGSGAAVAAAAVAVRPSAIATFAERLDMMANGLSYILRDPLFGVGPFQWRMLNLEDSDTYFNVWHIHNIFIHIGVELGLVAMAALIVVAVRHFTKEGGRAGKPGAAAFLAHNLIDTSLFYVSIPVFTLMTTACPRSGGTKLGAVWTRGLFLGLMGIFLFNLKYLLT